MSARRVAYDALTFDCYGTLIDWRGGLLEAVRSRPGVVGQSFDERRFLAERETSERSLQAGPYRPYRDIVGLSIQMALHEQGIPLPDEQAEAVAATVGEWSPFADVHDALRRLGDGRRLVIVSNVERRDIERTVAAIGIPFELLVTADEVRSYKPAKPHFRRAIERLGLPRERVLHVAQSLYHDIRPASDLGLDTAWINRLGEPLPPDLSVRHEVSDLAGLAAALHGR